MFKMAIVGKTAGCSNTDIDMMGAECANDVESDVNKDTATTIANKAISAGLNSNYTDRLVEATNKALVQKSLRSDSKATNKSTAKKSEVRKIVASKNMKPESDYSTVKAVKVASVNTQQSSPSVPIIKRSQADDLEKFAGIMADGNYEDYLIDPVSLGDEIQFNSMPEDDMSFLNETVLPDNQGKYAAMARDVLEGEVGMLELQLDGARLAFCKTAKAYVDEGTNFLDVIQGALMAEQSDDTAVLLKEASVYMQNYGAMRGDEAEEWRRAIDNISGSGVLNLRKTAGGTSLPVSESMLSKSLDGRVRVLNGDSVIVKHINHIGEIKKALKVKNIGLKTVEGEENRLNYSSRISNES